MMYYIMNLLILSSFTTGHFIDYSSNNYTLSDYISNRFSIDCSNKDIYSLVYNVDGLEFYILANESEIRYGKPDTSNSCMWIEIELDYIK